MQESRNARTLDLNHLVAPVAAMPDRNAERPAPLMCSRTRLAEARSVALQIRPPDASLSPDHDVEDSQHGIGLGTSGVGRSFTIKASGRSTLEKSSFSL